MSQERQKIINTCSKRHLKFVNFYEYDNGKNSIKFKNRYRRDGQQNYLIIQNQ